MTRALIGLVVCVSTLAGVSPAADEPSYQGRHPTTFTGRRPVSFVENAGQWPEHVAFAAQWGGAHVTASWTGIGLHAVVEDSGATNATGVLLRFIGAEMAGAIRGESLQPGYSSYFRGHDPRRWVRAARSFGSVRWSGVYPGVDVVLRSERGEPEYDLILAPGAELARIEMRCEGGSKARVDVDGSLVLETAAGTLRQRMGATWQVDETGATRRLEARFVVIDEDRFSFEVPGRNRSLALVIDPGLEWSTYLGSGVPGTNDLGHAIAAGPDGSITIVGATRGVDYPITPTSYQHPLPNDFVGVNDWFVTRMNSHTGELVYSSLMGGFEDDRAFAVDVDALGRAVVAGTAGREFPTTPGSFQPLAIPVNGIKAVLLRLNPTGTDLEYSTYVQGTSNEGVHTFDNFQVHGVAIDEATDSAIVAGWGYGLLPTTPGAFQEDCNCSQGVKGFVARLDPTGRSLEWASFLGGSRINEIFAVALAPDGRVAVTGRTTSRDFPVTPGVFLPIYGPPPTPTYGQPSWMSYLTVFEPDGSSLAHSTYFGGQGWIDVTFGNSVAHHPGGGWFLAGAVGNNSGESAVGFFTTPGAYQEQPAGGGEGFLVRFDDALSQPVFSTLLGGPHADFFQTLAVDQSGVATVSGLGSMGFPTTSGCVQPINAGVQDATIVRFSPTGSTLLHSTLLGGGGTDNAHGIALQPDGRASVVGTTLSPDFNTTPNALYPDYVGGQSDVFAATADLQPFGAEPFGRSTPSCLGPVQLGALVEPRSGNTTFGFYVTQAAPRSMGWLAVGRRGSASALVGGASFLLDPTRRVVRRAFTTDDDGFALVRWPLTQVPVGARFDAQAILRGTTACGGVARCASSQGLGIRVR